MRALPRSISRDAVHAGLRNWALHHGRHAQAAVELLIDEDWPSNTAFRAFIRVPESDPNMYVVDWRLALAALNTGEFVQAGSHNEAVLKLALEIGLNTYKLPTQGLTKAQRIHNAMTMALGVPSWPAAR